VCAGDIVLIFSIVKSLWTVLTRKNQRGGNEIGDSANPQGQEQLRTQQDDRDLPSHTFAFSHSIKHQLNTFQINEYGEL